MQALITERSVPVGDSACVQAWLVTIGEAAVSGPPGGAPSAK
jgi:hypothetical protein